MRGVRLVICQAKFEPHMPDQQTHTLSGYVPAWAAFLIGFLVFLCVGLPLGAMVGWGYGAEHERKAAEADAEAEELAAQIRDWGQPAHLVVVRPETNGRPAARRKR